MNFHLLSRLFERSKSIEEQLKEYGGEESPYNLLRTNTPEENELREGEKLIVDAIPSYRAFGSQKRTVHRPISGRSADALNVRITLLGNSYFWKSRKNTPLEYHFSGSFHYFTTPGAYVKICQIGSDSHFTEHFSYSMVTFSHWGKCSLFDISALKSSHK